MAQRQRRRRTRHTKVHLLVGFLPGPNPSLLGVAASAYLLKCAKKLRTDPEYESARNAIMSRVTSTDWQAFLDRAESGDHNSDVLTVLACGAALSAKVKTESIRETIARLAGKSAVELYSLPKQIEETAGDMERLNQDSWLSPENQLDPRALSYEVNRQLYNSLPGLMTGWAKALSLHLSYLERQSAVMLHAGWSASDYLHWCVEEACESPYATLVAELLHRATLILFDGEADKAKKASKFNQDMLMKRRERRLKRVMQGI
jgi:hypothetical protein